jgi:hypothetical protein
MALAPPPEHSLGEVSGDFYGFEEHLRRKGSGDNRLRTERIAQPGALRTGDVLGNGDRVLAPPREGYNGKVWVLLSGGSKGHWISVAARLPIALLVEADGAPPELIEEVQE